MIVFGFEKHWFWLKVYKKYIIVVKSSPLSSLHLKAAKSFL